MMSVPSEIVALRDRGALFVINHSGGKDSQAMTIFVRQHVPDAQILLVHADLPEVDWPGIEEHIRGSASGLPLEVCRNDRKTFFQMVRHRGAFPDPQRRQCTSDLKRGPIERTIRRYLKANPHFGGLVVNCMGMRAQESSGRAKLRPLKLSAHNSVAGREWYDWLPIHHWTTDEVFGAIAEAGQQPHPAYAAGMTRLSCCFCIMASRADLTTAAKLRPELYARYVKLEREIGRTMMMPGKTGPRGLEEITGIAAGGA